MERKSFWKIILNMLGFLVLILICVVIVAGVMKFIGPDIDIDLMVEQCMPVISENSAVYAAFGTPTNIIHQKKLGGFTWTPENIEGYDTFIVYGTKTNGNIKVHWIDSKPQRFQINKISITEPWKSDRVIWTRSNGNEVAD